MRRQLLTLLALLTGLAALGTPAHAAMGELLGAQVQSGSEADQEERRQACKAAKERKSKPLRLEDVPGCKPRKTSTIYLPTVMIGIDRAYE